MPTRSIPIDTLEQAISVLTACKQINPDLRAGTVSQSEIADDIAQTQSLQTQINVLELQLIDLRNKRDGRLTGIWEYSKRLRTTIKGVYGDDSSEYELVGGTRMSDRKRSARKHPAPPNVKSKTESQEVRAES